MTTSMFDESLRREMRAVLTTGGVPGDRAAQTVDLACHAADSALTNLHDVCRRAPDSGLAIAAIGMSYRVLGAALEAKSSQFETLARIMGLKADRQAKNG